MKEGQIEWLRGRDGMGNQNQIQMFTICNWKDINFSSDEKAEKFTIFYRYH